MCSTGWGVWKGFLEVKFCLKPEGKLIIKVKNKEEVIIDNKKWHMWRSSGIRVNLKHEKGTCKYVSKCWGKNLSH